MTALVVRADARRLPLPDGSVDLIVTSPPYFGVRSYTDGGVCFGGQLGSEATRGEWLDALLVCTREWLRVLKPTGSLWVNLGDRYASRGGHTDHGESSALRGRKHLRAQDQVGNLRFGVRGKSLLGLPWRYALGCVDQLGLILRAEVVWSKRNGLPESVTDRVRRSHETWFHFVQQPRYYAAVDEIRLHHAAASVRRALPHRAQVSAHEDTHDIDMTKACHPLGRLPGSVWEIASEPLTVPAELGVQHFAAFPTEWPRRLILGWSPLGICTRCGAPRRPVIARPGLLGGDNNPDRHRRSTLDGGAVRWALRMARPDRIVDYACACPDTTAPTRPGVVLDPFGGTGTTALVASVLGRIGITVDLSHDYGRLAAWRTADPGERAKAACVNKPPPRPEGQLDLFANAATSKEAPGWT